VRRTSLSLFILVATVAALLASPTASLADNDNGRGRGNDDDRRGQQQVQQNNDRRGGDQDDDRDDHNKVGICHFTGSERHTFTFIHVAQEAVAAHQRLGDIIGVNSRRDCEQQTNVSGAANGTINIGDTVCREGDACIFTVWQSRGTGAANVTWMTEDGTATGGASCTTGVDYISNVGTLSVSPSSTATLSIQTCTDNLTGPDESFRVRLTGASSGRIGDGTGRGILLETSVATTGGNTVLGTTDSLGQVTITWSATGGTENRVYFATGSSCLFGTTFQSFLGTATSGLLTGLTPNTLYCFQARQVVGGIETVIPATASGGTTAGSITISDTTCVEGATCSFTVTQTGGTASATVTYSTGNGTASGGLACTTGIRPPDFIQVTGGTVVVPANGSMPITVGTCTAPGSQLSETFLVVLSTTTSGTISDSSGQATISAG
jgi:hypothetical protein